jgi:uncharacterized peroxidase-related enzyme
MRLNKLVNGQRFMRRLTLRFIELVSGMPGADVIRMLTFHPEFFGKPYSDWLHEVMRGQSVWSVGERELFAAFTSRMNECQFCTSGHTAVSALALHNPDLVETVLNNWEQSPVNPKLKATLALLEKLTLEPETVTVEDIERIRATGGNDQAIEEAMYVCALFNMINRLADAFEFDPMPDASPKTVARVTKMLLKHGYKI